MAVSGHLHMPAALPSGQETPNYVAPHPSRQQSSIDYSENLTLTMSSIHNLTFREPCIVKYSYNKSQRDAKFLKLIFDNEL
jgi:hypothetical protein